MDFLSRVDLQGIECFDVNHCQWENVTELSLVYGPNGSGKTSVAKLLESQFRERKPRVLAYSRDYISKTIIDSGLPGVFTIGESDAVAEKELAKLRTEASSIRQQRASINDQLKQTRASIEDKIRDARQECWTARGSYLGFFPAFFEGTGSSKKIMQERMLPFLNAPRPASAATLDQLAMQYDIVFNESGEPLSIIPMVDWAKIVELQRSPLPGKLIVGSHDVELSKRYGSLDLMNWAALGFQKWGQSNNTTNCPFCGQSTREDFLEQLSDLFDEAYRREIRELEEFLSQYSSVVSRILVELSDLLSNTAQYMSFSHLKGAVDLLQARMNSNEHLLRDKVREPALKVVLADLVEPIAAIDNAISEANKRRREHNELIRNRGLEKERLEYQFWIALCDIHRAALSKILGEWCALEYSESAADQDESRLLVRSIGLNTEIAAIEGARTSIAPVLSMINGLLDGLGFRSFRLSASASGNNYRITRTNDSDADRESLSDGERTLLGFLYYYHCAKNLSDGDIVLVVDDPVSSLDSEVMYMIRTLLADLVELAAEPGHPIRQLVLLTHNAYFYKEVCGLLDYPGNAKNWLKGQSPPEGMARKPRYSYWRIEKGAEGSRFVQSKSPPVKSSYEALWIDLFHGCESRVAVRNTIRRIIETYFRHFGGMVNPRKSIPGLTEDIESRLLVESLLSGVNDGSHWIDDDLDVPGLSGYHQQYLLALEIIFRSANQSGHFDMMKSRALAYADS